MNAWWCNGAWQTNSRVEVAAEDRGWTLGLGLFETMLGENGRLVFGERHWARLSAGCRRLGWEPPWADPQAMAAVAGELMERAGVADGLARVRLALSGGSGPTACLAAGADRMAWMTAVAFAPAAAAPALALSPWPRNERGPLVGLKCGSYAGNLVALDHARRAGCSEILFFNTVGALCEAATANVFLVRNGRVSTPPLVAGCLPGITREVLLEEAPHHGIECAEETLTAEDLAAADEVILTSALRGPLAAASVAGRPLPPAPLAARLRELWWECVRRGTSGAACARGGHGQSQPSGNLSFGAPHTLPLHAAPGGGRPPFRSPLT